MTIECCADFVQPEPEPSISGQLSNEPTVVSYTSDTAMTTAMPTSTDDGFQNTNSGPTLASDSMLYTGDPYTPSSTADGSMSSTMTSDYSVIYTDTTITMSMTSTVIISSCSAEQSCQSITAPSGPVSTGETGGSTITYMSSMTSPGLPGPTQLSTFRLEGCLGPKPGSTFAQTFTLAEQNRYMNLERCASDCASSGYFGTFFQYVTSTLTAIINIEAKLTFVIDSATALPTQASSPPSSPTSKHTHHGIATQPAPAVRVRAVAVTSL
jgi:hypothetical protein